MLVVSDWLSLIVKWKLYTVIKIALGPAYGAMGKSRKEDLTQWHGVRGQERDSTTECCFFLFDFVICFVLFEKQNTLLRYHWHAVKCTYSWCTRFDISTPWNLHRNQIMNISIAPKASSYPFVIRSSWHPYPGKHWCAVLIHSFHCLEFYTNGVI